jgi:hypothetical protein
MAIQFVWRLCEINARVLAIALFMSELKFYITIVCGIQYLLMFAYIDIMIVTNKRNCLMDFGYKGVLTVVYLFIYMIPDKFTEIKHESVKRSTRYRYAAYYSFMFAENTLLMCLWYFTCDPQKW